MKFLSDLHVNNFFSVIFFLFSSHLPRPPFKKDRFTTGHGIAGKARMRTLLLFQKATDMVVYYIVWVCVCRVQSFIIYITRIVKHTLPESVLRPSFRCHNNNDSIIHIKLVILLYTMWCPRWWRW